MQILVSQSGYLSQQAESVWVLVLIAVFIYWKSLRFRKPTRPRDPPRDSMQASTYISSLSLSYGSRASTACSKEKLYRRHTVKSEKQKAAWSTDPVTKHLPMKHAVMIQRKKIITQIN
jgi:hypothetical protein